MSSAAGPLIVDGLRVLSEMPGAGLVSMSAPGSKALGKLYGHDFIPGATPKEMSYLPDDATQFALAVRGRLDVGQDQSVLDRFLELRLYIPADVTLMIEFHERADGPYYRVELLVPIARLLDGPSLRLAF